MTRIKAHIALFLLGLFFAPIIIQSVHITWHRHHCCLEHGMACQPGMPEKDLHHVSFSELQTEEQCPICNYQFPVNQLPEMSVYEKIVLLVTGFINETVINSYFRSVFSAISPRAPPFFV